MAKQKLDLGQLLQLYQSSFSPQARAQTDLLGQQSRLAGLDAEFQQGSMGSRIARDAEATTASRLANEFQTGANPIQLQLLQAQLDDQLGMAPVKLRQETAKGDLLTDEASLSRGTLASRTSAGNMQPAVVSEQLAASQANRANDSAQTALAGRQLDLGQQEMDIRALQGRNTTNASIAGSLANVYPGNLPVLGQFINQTGLADLTGLNPPDPKVAAQQNALQTILQHVQQGNNPQAATALSQLINNQSITQSQDNVNWSTWELIQNLMSYLPGMQPLEPLRVTNLQRQPR